MSAPASLDPSERRFLRSTSVFASLNERDFESVSAISRKAVFLGGQDLFQQGQPATAFFVVLEGWAMLLRDQSDGTRTVIKIVGPGESFAEAMLTPGARYPVSAEAASDITLARVDTERFRTLVLDNPGLGLSIIAATFRHLRLLVDQIEHLKSWPIERRLAGMLLQMCNPRQGPCTFDLPIRQHLLAARLAVTPPTLSRTFRKLAPWGVTARRGRITIRDPACLTRFVDGNERPVSVP